MEDRASILTPMDVTIKAKPEEPGCPFFWLDKYEDPAIADG